jgi:hypothetical protein
MDVSFGMRIFVQKPTKPFVGLRFPFLNRLAPNAISLEAV